MLGSAVGIAERCINNNDPATAGIIHIHVVDTDPGTGNQLQLRPGVQNIFINICAASGNNNLIITNGRQQLFLGETKFNIHLDPRVLLKKRQPFGSNLISNNNLHRCSPCLPYEKIA